MARLADVFQQARKGARLGEADMARLVSLDEATVRALESGACHPTPAELDAYAQVFGLSAAQFSQGEALRAPLMLLFRAASDGNGLPALNELAEFDGQRVLGEFLRCVRDTVELETLLGRSPGGALPALEPPRGREGQPPYGAEQMAAAVRRALGLGANPIPSMLDLLQERLEVRCFFVTPEELDPAIDGASTSSPGPAILVNLVEGAECWWRTRMTLGHELCHLLFDYGVGTARRALFSPRSLKRSRTRLRLFDGFEQIEQRASAFAACLLAPSESITGLLGTQDVTSEEAISLLCQTFFIGRTTAINRLQDIYHLSDSTRVGMQARAPLRRLPAEHPDRVLSGQGLRGGLLRDLALRACAAGRVDAVKAHEYLRIPLTEPLPEHPGLSAELRAPLRTQEDTVRAAAQRYLADREGAELCQAAAVLRVDGGWLVEVEEWGGNEADGHFLRGHLRLSYDLKVEDAALGPQS